MKKKKIVNTHHTAPTQFIAAARRVLRQSLLWRIARLPENKKLWLHI
jgi:hypothetical protein